jgi:ABC-2 type transport system permease protein
MFAVFKREFRSYFQSPVGYAYLAIFLCITNYIFYTSNVAVRDMYTATTTSNTDITLYFVWVRYILIITIPILAMKLFPEERKNKTDQVIITSPVSITGMVMGKFLAAYAVYVIGLIPTVFNMFFLADKGFLETGIVVSNYIGLLFVGAAFLAISMLMSVMTESMITAFILGAFSLAIFAVVDYIEQLLNNAFVSTIVNAISITQRFTEFNYGLFNVTSIIYFFSIALIFIFITIRIIDKRRWS